MNGCGAFHSTHPTLLSTERVSVHLRITIVKNGGSSVPERSCAIALPSLQFTIGVTCLTRQSFAMVGNQKTLPTLHDYRSTQPTIYHWRNLLNKTVICDGGQPKDVAHPT
ncbi:hypothetical protein QUF54_02540 [Candidatus Marithioploca araucensis]|uniref:Uncharacterized protein n=1 Tax=Candidatus Marithioploca araucensis TaxID=70273 RepID=A0ABT7VRA8_9GAMM|nr:hypothetical protein [Candidatus Marithioploca araucensis]